VGDRRGGKKKKKTREKRLKEKPQGQEGHVKGEGTKSFLPSLGIARDKKRTEKKTKRGEVRATNSNRGRPRGLGREGRSG